MQNLTNIQTQSIIIEKYFEIYSAKLDILEEIDHKCILNETKLLVSNSKKIDLKTIESVVADIEFPSLSFNFEGVNITHYKLDEQKINSVEPTTYYRDDYSVFMDKLHTFRLNSLLSDTKFSVVIADTSEFYDCEEEDDENLEWDDLQMYEAYIELDENEECLDDTTTGRYCVIESVIEEIEASVYELLDNDNKKDDVSDIV